MAQHMEAEGQLEGHWGLEGDRGWELREEQGEGTAGDTQRC